MNAVWKRVKENFTIKAVIGFIVLTILFLFGKSVIYTNEIQPRMADVYTEDAIPSDKNGTFLTLNEGDVITQDFIYPEDQMIAVGVELYSDAYKNKGNLTLKFYDNNTNELLGEGTFNVADLTDMRSASIDDIAYFNVGISNQVYGNENRPMRAELTVDSLSAKSSVYLYANSNSKGNHDPVVVNGTTTEKNESIAIRSYCYHYGYWEKFGKIGSIIVYIMLAGCYIAVVLFRAKAHNIFLLVGTCTAICYSLLLLPGTVPDEMQHIISTYYYSNKLMGIEEPDNESVYLRQTDMEALSKIQTTPTLKEYDYIMWNMFHRTDDAGKQLTSYGVTKGSDNWGLYIPVILGVTIGRILGFNGITTFFIGRGFAVVMYLLFAYLALRKLPVGKAAMFVLVISPMFVQQSCSFSYDSLPILLSVVFVAELFSVLYEDRKIKNKEIVFMAILAFFIGSSKGGVYIPECLLFFLIPKDKFESDKQCKKARIFFVLALAVGFLVNTVSYLSLVLGFTQATTETQKYSDSLNCYTVSEVLLQPGHTIYVLLTTILTYADFYFEGIFSGPLGWLNIGINPFWAYSMAVLMFLGITTVSGEPEYITKKHRIFIGLALLVTVAMITASMFVSWTPSGSTTVSGIQGRYLTPVFFYMLFALRGKFIKIAHNIDYVIMFLAVALDVIVISNILSSIQTVM